MRARVLIAPWVGLLFTACGGFDNGPLHFGGVTGTVAQATAIGSVSLFGSSPLQTTPLDSSGAFTLDQVPAGTADLFIIASPTGALRVTANVEDGQRTDLGALTPLAAAYVEFHLVAPGLPNPERGAVSVDGTPLSIGLDPLGQAHLGPLPEGCYTGTVTHPNAGEKSFNFCVSPGDDREVQASF